MIHKKKEINNINRCANGLVDKLYNEACILTNSWLHEKKWLLGANCLVASCTMRLAY
jgi:hypothetical protein